MRGGGLPEGDEPSALRWMAAKAEFPLSLIHICIGTMTQYLAEAAREVAAVEIDSSLIPILKDTLKDWDNVSVINNDILKTDIKKIADEKNGGKPVKVVANLPYYITTPIIMGLFEKNVPVDSITVMVQKEVADRMQVGPRCV